MRDINLLPESYRASSSHKLHKYLFVGIVAVAAIAASYGTFLYYQLIELKAENQAKQEMIAKIREDKSANDAEKRAAMAWQLVSARREVSASLSTLFREIDRSGIVITRITRFETGEVVISGKGSSSEQITGFSEALHEAKGFEQLTVRFIRETGPGEYLFELQGSM